MIELKTFGVLKHINVRKEGPEEAKAPAMDLKIEAVVPAEFIDQIIMADDTQGKPSECFWNDDGSPRFIQLGELATHYSIASATFEMAGLSFTGCSAKKFSFKPTERRNADLVFAISITDFKSNALPILAELLHDSSMFHLTVPQGDLFDGDNEQECKE